METKFKGWSSTQYNWLFAGLLLSILLTQLDQTIVSTALPTIATQLEGFAQMSWVFTIYMLTSTAITPIAGKLSDLYGRKLFLILGLTIFVIGSVLCGMADTMLQLIIFRGIKGIGAGFLMPITYTVVFSLMPRTGNSIYQTLYMSIFALSSVIGPAIGALITSLLDWRYIFFINLPFGLLILVIFLRLLPHDPSPSHRGASIGYLSPALLITGTLSLLLALKLGGVQFAWSSVEIIGLLAAGIGLGAWFVLQQLREKEPIIPMPLFRDRVIASTYMATFMQGIIMYGSLVYIPLFVQGGLGGGVAGTGGALTPLMLCVMLGATLCGALISRTTWRFTISTAMLLSGSGIVLLIFLPINVSFIVLCLVMVLIGLGIGMMMMVGQTAVSMGVDESVRGAATSSVSFFRSIGGVLGTAVLTVLVYSHLSRLLAEHRSELTGLATAPGTVTDPLALLSSSTDLPANQLALLRQLLGDAVQYGFWFLVGAAALGFLAAFWAGAARQAPHAPVAKSEAAPSQQAEAVPLR